uniref:Leucine-rich repeat domain-containing protein n=1 Tax=Geladintestivirus 1 TaxID=3233133 RepID=A0AAU8MK63_9CAUD
MRQVNKYIKQGSNKIIEEFCTLKINGVNILNKIKQIITDITILKNAILKVTSYSGIFGSKTLKEPLYDIVNPFVTDISSMFAGATVPSINNIILDNVTTANSAFVNSHIKKINKINLPNCTEVNALFAASDIEVINELYLPKAENINNIFTQAKIKINKLKLGKNVKTASTAFASCNIEEIGNINLPNCTAADYMFASANIKKVGNIILPNCIHAGGMFTESKIEHIGDIILPNSTIRIVNQRTYIKTIGNADFRNNTEMLKDGFVYTCFKTLEKIGDINFSNVPEKDDDTHTYVFNISIESLENIGTITFPDFEYTNVEINTTGASNLKEFRVINARGACNICYSKELTSETIHQLCEDLLPPYSNNNNKVPFIVSQMQENKLTEEDKSKLINKGYYISIR